MRISDWSSDVCSSDLASRQGILIVGSTHWSLSLADHLRQLGISVMVSDSSWERLSAARQQGIPSFHGEILAEATEYRLDLSQFQVLAATTDNEPYNTLGIGSAHF